MAVERVNSEIQLKCDIFKAARDGKAAIIIKKLRNLNRCTIVKEILDHHTQENGQDTTPLIIAARNGHKYVVIVLLGLGVNVEQTGTIVFDEQVKEEVTPLWCASAIGHLDMVKILVEYGANVNSKTRSKSTALRAACFDGYIEIVKFLAEHGADIHASNDYRNNCLMIASYNGHYAVVEYLIKKGLNLNRKDVYGKTAVHECAINGHVKILDLLVRNGAKIAPDENNLTPLMMAALRGVVNVVEYFIKETMSLLEEKVDAVELLGTTFGIDEKQQDMDKAYFYLKKAMKNRTLKNVPISTRAISMTTACDNWTECRNLSELETIKTNINDLKMESLAKRERILGPGHPDVIKAIVIVGDYLIDNYEYTKGLKLWLYALTQYRDAQAYVALWFPNTLAYMMEMNQTLEPNTVLDAFQIFTIKLESCLLQMEERKGDGEFLKETCEDITIDCVHLVAILLTMYTNRDSLEVIHQIVYKFLKLEPRLQNGFTPLHMCCSTYPYTEYNPLLNVVQFPNHSLCKTFITCGSNVNARDNENNTPLHRIVKCEDSVTDFDSLTEILSCLIESGAHLDIRNKENKTAADIASTDCIRSLLMTKMEIYLKCITASVVRKHDIVYKNFVPRDLQDFIELH